MEWSMLALLLVLNAVPSVLLGKINWCEDFACKEKHTMCQFPTDQPAKACNGGGDQQLTVKEIEGLLHAHNSLRDHVAAGREDQTQTGMKMPPAADMELLVWNSQMAEVAQRYARQCYFEHDSCRHLPGMAVGQNLFKSWITGYTDAVPKTNMTANAMAWYLKEVGFYRHNDIKPFKFTERTGHFTQFVWSRSNQLGCGYAGHPADEEGWYSYLLVCNYGPSGNYMGSHLYKEGKPCSHCPAGTSCGVDPRYPHLCGPPKNKIPKIEEPGGAKKSDHSHEVDDPEIHALNFKTQIISIEAAINTIKAGVDLIRNGEFDDASMILPVTELIRASARKISTAVDSIDRST